MINALKAEIKENEAILKQCLNDEAKAKVVENYIINLKYALKEIEKS